MFAVIVTASLFLQRDQIDWDYLNSKYASNNKWTFFLRKAARCLYSKLEMETLAKTRAAKLPPELDEKRQTLECEFIVPVSYCCFDKI